MKTTTQPFITSGTVARVTTEYHYKPRTEGKLSYSVFVSTTCNAHTLGNVRMTTITADCVTLCDKVREGSDLAMYAPEGFPRRTWERIIETHLTAVERFEKGGA